MSDYCNKQGWVKAAAVYSKVSSDTQAHTKTDETVYSKTPVIWPPSIKATSVMWTLRNYFEVTFLTILGPCYVAIPLMWSEKFFRRVGPITRGFTVF